MRSIQWKCGAVVAALLAAGCASVPLQSAYQSSERKAPFRFEIGRTQPDGQSRVRLSGGPLLGAVVNGEARSDGAGGWEVGITSLDWFNNWQDGWTDAVFVVDGSFKLVPENGGYRLQIESSPEIDAPYAASMRYYDDYLGGPRALEQFSRRWDRIEAYTRFFHSRFDERWLADSRTVRRFLFPELFGYAQPPAADHAVVKADSIAWNLDYTRTVFPENLRDLRDSGTMLRDYEETPSLWELAYEWSALWSTTLPAEIFREVKL